jgi:hypothetical protein
MPVLSKMSVMADAGRGICFCRIGGGEDVVCKIGYCRNVKLEKMRN